MITLFQWPGGEGLASASPPCVKVHLTLKRMGLTYETKTAKNPFDAKRASATGRLPAIDIDGTRISDSSAILDALQERFPEKAFFPTEPLAAAQDRVMETYANETLYAFTGYFRWLEKDGARRFAQWLTEQEGFLIGRVALPLLFARGFRKRLRTNGVGLLSPDEVCRGLDRALETIEACLQGGPFLHGRDTPGRGDIAIASCGSSLLFPGGMARASEAFARRPAAREHAERVFESCSTEAPPCLSDVGRRAAAP